MKKIGLSFKLFGLILAIISYLRIRLGLLPGETADAVIWFLAGPMIWIEVYFSLPEAILPFLLIIYYFIIGIIFSKLAQQSNRRLYLSLVACALVFLHYASASAAARILGKILENIIKGWLSQFSGTAK